MQVVRQINGNEHSGGRRVDGHVVRRVVQELSSCVTLNVVRVVISPPQLYVDPVLLRRCVVHGVSTNKSKDIFILLSIKSPVRLLIQLVVAIKELST